MNRRKYLFTMGGVVVLAGCSDEASEPEEDEPESGEDEPESGGIIELYVDPENNPSTGYSIINRSDRQYEVLYLKFQLNSERYIDFNWPVVKVYDVSPGEERSSYITPIGRHSDEVSDARIGLQFDEESVEDISDSVIGSWGEGLQPTSIDLTEGNGIILEPPTSDFVFELPPEEHGVDDPIEVESEALRMSELSLSLRDDGTVLIKPNAGSYWLSTNTIRITSTTSENEFDVNIPKPEASLNVTDVSISEDQAVESINIEVTAENPFPVYEAHIEGVGSTKNVGSTGTAIGYPVYTYNFGHSIEHYKNSGELGKDYLRDVAKTDTKLRFNEQLVGVEPNSELGTADQLIKTSIDEMEGQTEEYEVSPNFTPSFPLEDDETLTLYLYSGYEILDKYSINMTDLY